MSRKYSSGKIDWVRSEDLKHSENAVGQVYPVIKDAKGDIIDGFHRKRVNEDWKEVILPIHDELESMKLRVHLNIIRRKIPGKEKREWIQETRQLLKDRLGREPTQKELADALDMKHSWVMKWDPKEHWKWNNKSYNVRFFGYNVWGFKDESWQKLVLPGDPNQPDKEEYHGHTPSFVIHQLIKMFEPKLVLDSMAGVGTTGYVCKQYGIECDQFDVYPYPKYGILEGDAETIEPAKTYDLVFNHIPYLRMTRYGDHPQDLSNMNLKRFFDKLHRIFETNHRLLNKEGVYAVLVGNWRSGGRLIPLTEMTVSTGLAQGFILYDEAIKLTSEMQSKSLQEYRAAKFGYMAQAFDTVLIFKKQEPPN